MEVELHIGVHRVFGQVLRIGCSMLPPESGHSVKLLDEEYKTIVLPAISDIMAATSSDDVIKRKIMLLNDLNSDRIIISKASILCQEDKIYTKGVVYGNLDASLANIIDLFSGCEIVIHLCITNMYDFITGVRGLSQRRFDSGLVQKEFVGFSWHRLVSNIRDIAPMVPIEVWDCENRREASLDFISGVLGVDVKDVQRKMGQKGLDKIFHHVDSEATYSNSLIVPDDIGTRLDLMYDDDLEKVAGIRGVTLWRG